MAVQRAIRSGRITTVNGKIDPDQADAQWLANTDQGKPRNRFTGDPKHRRGPGEPSTPMPMDDGEGASGIPDGTRTARGYAHARAAREGYEARLAKAKFERVTGESVRTEEVRVAAFNRARRTRDLLLALPDRLAALLAAESDQNACHRILTEEIGRVCEELSRAQRV